MSTRRTTPEREYESLRQASQRVEISVFTLREKIAAGELPAFRFSDKPAAEMRVKLVDVNALFRPVLPVEVYGGSAPGC